MVESSFRHPLRIIAAAIDPRRSLSAGAMWLIIALAGVFSCAAALWVGHIARDNVLEQHVRRLALETDQLSSELGQTITAHLGAVQTAGALLRTRETSGRPQGLSDVYDELVAAYPQFEWLGIADPDGRIVNSNGAWRAGSDVGKLPWFDAARRSAWIGVIDQTPPAPADLAIRQTAATALGDIAIPIRNQAGYVVGVIAARLSWRRTAEHPTRLTDEVDPRGTTTAYVLDRSGTVLVGPRDSLSASWKGVPEHARDLQLSGSDPSAGFANALQFERLPGGQTVLVSRAPLNAGSEFAPLGLQVLLSEPHRRVYQRADALVARILWVSLSLGVATALIGALGARRLTRRLQRLTLSVTSIDRAGEARIEVPHGRDEVAQLGAAFAHLIDDLGRERSELKTLSNELERRVALRTREVERLADESRYAAIVRERLQMARDLHDTLAHSIMALLSEIRFIRRLQTHDPVSVAGELARAEQLAHEGLREVRTAITQMRVNAVRETGLGPALATAFERFTNHTGVLGEFVAEPEAARFGDVRAETLLRMAQEVLRNIERHAMATRVYMTLQVPEGARLSLVIDDNGIGFDTERPRPGHYGVDGLYEQAELIGATLTIDSHAEGGTRVSISVPLSPQTFCSSPAASSLEQATSLERR